MIEVAAEQDSAACERNTKQWVRLVAWWLGSERGPAGIRAYLESSMPQIGLCACGWLLIGSTGFHLVPASFGEDVVGVPTDMGRRDAENIQRELPCPSSRHG